MSNLASVHSAATATTAPRPAISAWPDVDNLYRRFAELVKQPMRPIRADRMPQVMRYFDERGPGEVVDLDEDDRAHRAYRFPEPHEELPYRAGSTVTTRLGDALGLALADAELISASVTTPTLPATVIEGPSQVTLGNVAVYAF